MPRRADLPPHSSAPEGLSGNDSVHWSPMIVWTTAVYSEGRVLFLFCFLFLFPTELQLLLLIVQKIFNS